MQMNFQFENLLTWCGLWLMEVVEGQTSNANCSVGRQTSNLTSKGVPEIPNGIKVYTLQLYRHLKSNGA